MRLEYLPLLPDSERVEISSAPFEVLKKDLNRIGVELDDEELKRIKHASTPTAVRAGNLILSQCRIADRIIFLTKGIAASEQNWPDGTSTIGRFFEHADFCTNLASAWSCDMASEDLLAITDVMGLAFPAQWFQREYLHGNGFGTYLRWRIMEAHLFDRDLICVKTSARMDKRYGFLKTHHRDVIGRTPQKDIARFLGVTPQGLSRYLRRLKAHKPNHGEIKRERKPSA
ncbi:MAG: hypothetical protein AAGF88_04040 [Pseudomonadota bacterium]